MKVRDAVALIDTYTEARIDLIDIDGPTHAAEVAHGQAFSDLLSALVASDWRPAL